MIRVDVIDDETLDEQHADIPLHEYFIITTGDYSGAPAVVATFAWGYCA